MNHALCSVVIILVLLLSFMYINNSTEHRECLIDFDSDKFYKHYLKNGIKINPINNTLTKNGITINYTNHFNTPESRYLADDKIATKKILHKNNIPTPKSYLWNSHLSDEYNIHQLKKLNFPLVVKPVNGTYGNGVTVGIETIRETVNRIHKLLNAGNPVMIEEMVEGNVFRILVFANTVVDIYKKEPGYVIGNGISTLRKLIANDVFEKEIVNGFPVKDVEWDYVSKQGYTIDDVIPLNIKIILTHAANVNNGAVVSPVNLEDVHPDNMKLFKKINKVCGLNLNGIDYITPSLSIPYHKYGSVIENNARPGVKGHYLMNPDSIDKFVKLIRFGKKTREGVVFNADYLHPYYDKYGISIDTKTKTLQKNGKKISYSTQFNPPASKLISKDKIKSKEIFIKHQIPTPKYYKWNKNLTFNNNMLLMNNILKFPIVIKPSDSYAGDGVHTNITRITDAKKIISTLLKNTNDILIEEYINGHTYRILLFNNQVIYAYRVIKPVIIGDGKHTVIQLINIMRKETPINTKQINIDQIHKQGYRMDSVLPKNKNITITDIANSTYGSEREIISIDRIHPDNIKMFRRLNNITKLNLNGIDYISNRGLDIPYYQSNGNILETNSSPGISFIPNIEHASDRFMKAIDFN